MIPAAHARLNGDLRNSDLCVTRKWRSETLNGDETNFCRVRMVDEMEVAAL